MGKPKPRNFSKKNKIVRRKYRSSAYSAEELHKYRKRRRIFPLVKKLRTLEVRALVAAFIHVESIGRAGRIFAKIAKKYNVSSGDLEQALAIKLGPKVWGALKDIKQRKTW